MGTAQEDTFTLINCQTDGERKLLTKVEGLTSRVVRLEATVRLILISAGEVPIDFEWEAVDLYTTALEAKANIDKATDG